MKLETEDKPPIENVSDAQVQKAIARLKSYGPCSFASLIDKNENYLQVAGGEVTCMLEKRDAVNRRHYRAYQDESSKVFEDGTELVFGGGRIALRADEWFTATQIEETFLAFLKGNKLPESIKWREITGLLIKRTTRRPRRTTSAATSPG